MKDQYDIVIIGSGIAGMYAALHLDPSLSVLLLAKGELSLSNSSLAQGGIAAVLQTEDDDLEQHFADTMLAGGNENNPEAVRLLVREGPSDVRELLRLGVDFDKDASGALSRTLEGGHSRRRIYHYKDQTGLEIMRKLSAHVLARPNVTALEKVLVVGTQPMEQGFRVDWMLSGKPHRVCCNGLLLATGGIGQLYRYTTNSSIATGDGIRFAQEMGAKVRNLSYVQFHPTAFSEEGVHERFLVSEAVRGEGARLLNCFQQSFMERYDPRLELAPRDVVSRSIILESRRTGSNRFYLDISHREADFIRRRFPAISAKCLEQQLDMTKQPIPVFPCQHYLMGGIDTNLWGKTTVRSVYAAGECAHTGVHGKNRLASNSLLEALVFGRRAAESMMGEVDFVPLSGPGEAEEPSGSPLPRNLRGEIQNLMQRAYFVLPDRGAVYQGMQRMEEILHRLQQPGFAMTREYCEVKSLATIGYTILKEVYHQ